MEFPHFSLVSSRKIFKYDRFLNEDTTVKDKFYKKEKRLKYYTMPWGAGRGMCVGKEFAVKAIKQWVQKKKSHKNQKSFLKFQKNDASIIKVFHAIPSQLPKHQQNPSPHNIPPFSFQSLLSCPLSSLATSCNTWMAYTLWWSVWKRQRVIEVSQLGEHICQTPYSVTEVKGQSLYLLHNTQKGGRQLFNTVVIFRHAALFYQIHLFTGCGHLSHSYLWI